MPSPQLNEFSGLSDAISNTRTAGARFGGATTRFIGATNSIDSERSQFRGGLSNVLARQTAGSAGGNSFASTIRGTLRQAKVRQGIANRGEASIRGQQLRDRLAVARLGIRKRQRGISSLGSAANIREGVNLANANADSSIATSNADLFGSIAGAGAAVIKDRREPTTSPPGGT